MIVRRDADGYIINAEDLKVGDVVGQAVRCPACGGTFNKWPLGWDRHAEFCTGIRSGPPEQRKREYKQMFSFLFR